METLTLILVVAAIIALCILGMAISILVKKNGKFPETEVGHNKNMRKLGLQCAKQEEIALWRKQNKRPSGLTTACSDCACGCFDEKE